MDLEEEEVSDAGEAAEDSVSAAHHLRGHMSV